jgi:hypothetical protein
MVVYNRIIRPIFLKHEGDVNKVLSSATDKLGELAGGGEYNVILFMNTNKFLYHFKLCEGSVGKF